MGRVSATGEKPPHMVLVPFLSPGHFIPMADLGRLLTQRGARVSFVTTPLNAARLRSSFERSRASGLLLDLVSLPLPSSKAGLPEGYESLDAIPAASFLEMSEKLLLATELFGEPLRQFMSSAGATCLISDFCMPCTRYVARDLGIPLYIFYSICCFTLYCHRVMPPYFEAHKVEEDLKPVLVPGLPHRVEVNREQAGGICSGAPEWFLAGQAESEAIADGLVVNTFMEMEPDYVEVYSKETGKNVFTVGPVSICNTDAGDREARAGGFEQPSGVVDCQQQITKWLNSQAPRSVVYVCLGSLVRELPRQLKEIGAGLQASGMPFLWVVRNKDQEVETCLGEIEQGSRDRCMIIRGWVSQLAILSHPSVGGFLSHCGWNSTAEAVACGVPLAAWPCFADQIVNAKFAVDAAGVGVPVVGCERPLVEWWGEEKSGRRMVGREEVEAAVRRLMDGGEEAEARRGRAVELADKARRALQVGGSSETNLTALIEESVKLDRERGQGLPSSCIGLPKTSSF